jgi:7,8-dihydropterin-6-yl-methyl-4-(beta-D-ribofuranosyl)aminobenzene 5'-phosphate synthase
MKVTVIIDNTENPCSDLCTEHGLSFYFEIDHKKWMLDVGASSSYAENAGKLGISIADVDVLMLSHAHADHTGGLRTFLEKNSHAKIYLSSHIDDRGYYSTRRGRKRNISIDNELLKAYPDRFVMVDSDFRISSHVSLQTEIPNRYLRPKANATLLAGEKQDNFDHEIVVKIQDEQGAHLLSSCSHLGILNTLATCLEGTVQTYIGGLHLIDSDAEHTYETDAELKEIGERIRQDYPDLKIYTGHCTGAHAMEVLSTILGERIQLFYTGAEIIW